MAARKRKSIGDKVRFEVFKRDSFKCQYCGRTAPEIVLVVDHVQPHSKGGGADVLNLITSCRDCNSGKGAVELSDGSAIAKQRAQIEELSERRAQLEMMLKWREGVRDIEGHAVEAVHSRYKELFVGWHLNDAGIAGVRKQLKKHSLAKVLDTVEKTASQYLQFNKDGTATEDSVKIAWSKISGIIYIDDLPTDEKELYYVRGIMRKRFNYCPDWKSIKLLRAAVTAGAEPLELKDLAKGCNSWGQFVTAIGEEWGVHE